MNKLDKQYLDLVQDILDNGVKKGDRTGTGTLSVFGRQIRHKMSDGFPLLTTKKMYVKGIVTELLWFLRGDTNIKYLVDNGCNIWNGDAFKNYLKHTNEYKGNVIDHIKDFGNEILVNDEFARKWGELGPTYGKQWRNWQKGEAKVIGHNGTHNEWGYEVVDQIANLINDLKTNPDSRRLIVSAWNVGEIDQVVLPPCHNFFQCWTREMSVQERKKYDIHFDALIGEYPEHHITLNERGVPRRALSLIWNQRSVDTGLGLPFNIASYGLLLEILAKIVNMMPDELVGNLGDTHVYLDQVDGIKEQLTREPFDLPQLSINTEFWNNEYQSIDGLINSIEIDDFQVINYKSHSTIKLPLSN